MKRKGFSLIELMVVIAIVALLAAVASPAYQAYQTRVKVANAYNILSSIGRLALVSFNQNGQWPTTLSYSDYSWNVCDVSVGGCSGNVVYTPNLNSSNIHMIQIDYYSTTNVLRIIATLNGLSGIQGYIEPSVSELNGSNYIGLSLKENDGVTVTQCGIDDPTYNYYIPIAYQPSACTCQYLNNYSVYGGVPNCAP